MVSMSCVSRLDLIAHVPTVESDVDTKDEVVGANVEETGPVECPTGPVDRQKNTLTGW